jgi:hypothetical protein
MLTGTRTKKKAALREVHLFWIDFSDFYSDYAIWKEAGPKSKRRSAPIVRVARMHDFADVPQTSDPEFSFAVEELETAFNELAGRKASSDSDEPYGETVEIGSSRLTLLRTDRYEYDVYAPCGEVIEMRAGELRALVSAVRDLEVSTV